MELIIAYSIAKAKQFLRKAEGYLPAPHKDIGGVITNGYGNTRLNPTCHVSPLQALADLEANIQYFDNQLIKVLGKSQQKLQSHEYAALLCFAFNCGVGKKTIWQLIKQSKLDQIPNEMRKWSHVNGKVIQGLVNRREAEIALWNTADLPQAMLPVPRVQVEKAPDLQKTQQANKAVIATTSVVPITWASIAVTQHPHYLLPVSVGIILIISLITLWLVYKILKAITPIKEKPMSDAFNAAFSTYEAAVTAKQADAIKIVQDKLDAANQQIAQLQQTVIDNDAGDIKTVNDATAALQQQPQSEPNPV